MHASHEVHVLLVAGLLGSGKSSLLKYCLHNNENYKIAVIKNEFSDTDTLFEIPLLINDDDESAFKQYLELPNDCICCTPSTKLTRAIDELLLNNSSNKKLDLIMIEISGSAQVTDVYSKLLDYEYEFNLQDERERNNYVMKVNTPICLVDATWLNDKLDGVLRTFKNFKLSDMDDYHDSTFNLNFLLKLFIVNCCCCDLVLINKTDIVKSVDSIVNTVQQINPCANCITTQFSAISIHRLLQLATTTIRKDLYEMLTLSQQDRNLNSFSCKTFYFDDSVLFDINKLQTSLENILWNAQDSSYTIFRGKGIINGKYEIQIVHDTINIKQINSLLTSGNASYFYLIGTNISDETRTLFVNTVV